MSKSASTNKIILLALVVLVGGAAWFGYSKQTENLQTPGVETNMNTTAATAPAPKPDAKVFQPQADDIVLGKADAPITIIEYASLSCPHCAHFTLEVLPTLKKEYIDTGKAKLIYRHFPLNAPALRAAQLVNCADAPQREKFLQVLFSMQAQWAFNKEFVNEIKQIANVGGIDSAQFDSCLNDKDGETRIVETRKRGAEEAQVTATPSFFINGTLMAEAPEMDSFRDAIAKQAK